MIIKNKPFHIFSAQCVQCAFYFPAAVLGCVTRPCGHCDFDHVWRFAGFQRFGAYQVRLSRYLVMRCAILKAQASPLFPAWDDPRSEGGVL